MAKVIQVSCCRGASIEKMGRLALVERRIFFEYTTEFLKTGLELSPLRLPLKPGVLPCEDSVFGGLFGIFNDSLPDGWGRLLLDRKLMKAGISPESLTALDRLCYVGTGGMGALTYQPEFENKSESPPSKDLDQIAAECLLFLENEGDQYVEDLLALNGSSAGARPKVLVRLKEQEDWIIKFRSFLDPPDIGPIEYAYHLMAAAAGIEVPAARLFPSRTCQGYFGVKRFDREGSKRLHMHTASGLLHADHRFPSLDYETLMKATLWLTKDIREAEKLLRLAAFNVFAHNRDDHAKNFSFLMDEEGQWRLSPAYDLTFSSGPGGEHSTAVMHEGKSPGKASLMKLAQVANIPSQLVVQIIEQVKGAVARWPQYAEEAQVTARSLQHIKNELAKNL